MRRNSRARGESFSGQICRPPRLTAALRNHHAERGPTLCKAGNELCSARLPRTCSHPQPSSTPSRFTARHRPAGRPGRLRGSSVRQPVWPVDTCVPDMSYIPRPLAWRRPLVWKACPISNPATTSRHRIRCRSCG